jgi:hypothetical protein
MQSTSLVFAALRTFATRAQRQRPLPHSKAVIRQRVPAMTTTWGSHDGPSQPRLAAKYLRHAERVAWELGVVEEMRQFEEAAAAFPNPPKLVAATCVCGGGARCPFSLPATPPPPPRAPARSRTHTPLQHCPLPLAWRRARAAFSSAAT